MSDTGFVEPGTFVRPGLLGRGVRLAVGLVLLASFWSTANALPFLAQGGIPKNGYWIGLLLSFWVLPSFVDPTFGRPVGRKVQIALIVLALVAGGYSLGQTGHIWGAALGVLTGLTMLYVTAHGALAFILAGLFAVPG